MHAHKTLMYLSLILAAIFLAAPFANAVEETVLLSGDPLLGDVVWVGPAKGIDPACAVDQARKMVQAVDGHKATYLKAIFFRDDDLVAGVLDGNRLEIRRPKPEQALYLSKEIKEPHFLTPMGKDTWTVGILPEGVNFKNCGAKGQ